jgi:hypothetical protein
VYEAVRLKTGRLPPILHNKIICSSGARILAIFPSILINYFIVIASFSLPDRQFGTDYMARLMAESGYDAIGISVSDFYEGPAPLSDYMTRLIAASGGSSPAPTFLASKCVF